MQGGGDFPRYVFRPAADGECVLAGCLDYPAGTGLPLQREGNRLAGRDGLGVRDPRLVGDFHEKVPPRENSRHGGLPDVEFLGDRIEKDVPREVPVEAVDIGDDVDVDHRCAFDDGPQGGRDFLCRPRAPAVQEEAHAGKFDAHAEKSYTKAD